MNVKSHSNQQTIEQPPLIQKDRKEGIEDYAVLDELSKTIRIAVSGNVILTKREVLIVDTPEFQKLRKYRQLGSSYLVYPSANHTRFEHSLGVLYMSQVMIEAIQNNQKSEPREKEISDQQKRIIRLVALLHDIANFPFGHTLEDETHVVNSNQDDSQRLRDALGESTKIGRVLRDNLINEDYQLFFDVLLAKESPKTKTGEGGAKVISDLKENAFMVDIVKNTVCADLLDYLKRDSYFCNIGLEISDTFLNYLFIHEEPKKVRRVAIRLWKNREERPRQAVISELVQLLETRYFLAERVYFHHAKRISSSMVASAVYHAQVQGKDALTLMRLSELGDDELLNELSQPKMNQITKDLALAYSDRRLYKKVYTLSIDDFRPDLIEYHLNHLKETYHNNAAKRAKKEQEICEMTGLKPGSILIYCPNPDMNMKTAEMKVTWNGGVCALKEITDKLMIGKINSIAQSHYKLWQLQVFIPNEIKKNSKKEDLIKIYCKKVFEAWDDQEGDIAELAMRKVFDDIISEGNFDPNLLFSQNLVKDCFVKNRMGPITRAEIIEEIKNKTESKNL